MDILILVLNIEMFFKDDEFVEIYNDRVIFFVEFIKVRENVKKVLVKNRRSRRFIMIRDMD